MIRRLAATTFATALLSGGLVLTAGAAHAAPCPQSSPAYPGNSCVLSTSASSAAAGAHVQVAGDGFSRNCGVTIRLDSTQIGTATSDGSGHFATDVAIPSSASLGAHSLTASDQCS